MQRHGSPQHTAGWWFRHSPSAGARGHSTGESMYGDQPVRAALQRGCPLLQPPLLRGSVRAIVGYHFRRQNSATTIRRRRPRATSAQQLPQSCRWGAALWPGRALRGWSCTLICIRGTNRPRLGWTFVLIRSGYEIKAALVRVSLVFLCIRGATRPRLGRTFCREHRMGIVDP